MPKMSKTPPQESHNSHYKGSGHSMQSRNDTQNNHNKTETEYPTSSQVHVNYSTSNEYILLRTALMQIEYRDELFTIRVLIDPGPQRTFLTERIRNRLQLPYQTSSFEIVGTQGDIILEFPLRKSSYQKPHINSLLVLMKFLIPANSKH